MVHILYTGYWINDSKNNPGFFIGNSITLRSDFHRNHSLLPGPDKVENKWNAYVRSTGMFFNIYAYSVYITCIVSVNYKICLFQQYLFNNSINFEHDPMVHITKMLDNNVKCIN